MYNSQVPDRGKVAKWLEDFVNTMSGKKEEPVVNESENIKTADINVQDLPKVVWNDETFYVLFDNEKSTAKLYNRFSNEVTTIKNVNSIEDVDKHLNSTQVVTSEFDDELKKVTEADMNGNPDNMQNTDNSQIPADPNAAPIDPNQQPMQDPNNPNSDQNAPQQPIITASAEDYEDYDYATINSILQKNFDSEAYYVGSSDEYVRFFVAGEKLNLKEAIELIEKHSNYTSESEENTAEAITEDIEKMGETLDYMKRIADLEEKVQFLTNTVEELRGQLFARQDPGNIYDSNTMAEEVKHIQETSQATADQIAQDNAIDITTMNGRISLVERLRQDLKPIMEMTEEIPEETIEIEEPVEIETTDIEVNDEDKPETEEVTDEPVVENTTPEEKEDETEEDEEEDEDKKSDIISLNAKDSKIFKKAICPHCGDDGLTKAAQVGSYVGVYCKGCTAEYAVNVNTEEVFIKN